MKELWADPAFRERVAAGRKGGKSSRARFSAHVATDSPRKPWALSPDHPAVVNGHSIFNFKRTPKVGRHVLLSGMHQRKIGHRIIKGEWSGLPVYTLSLEERATCPRSCKVWEGCYGNAMPYAARWEHGPAFERALFADLFWLAGRRHDKGFVVRLHVLGDFYSTGYVDLWREAFVAIPGLRVWGYTAHGRGSEIGRAVDALNKTFPDRCAIRFSGTETIVIRSHTERGGAIVCPAETGAAANCGSCALCWAPAARDKTIAFLFHGNPGRGEAA